MKRLEFKNYTGFKSKISYRMTNYRYLNRNMETIELKEDGDVVAAYFDYLTAALSTLRGQVGYDRIKSITDHLHARAWARVKELTYV